jgi:hypothetical protein
MSLSIPYNICHFKCQPPDETFTNMQTNSLFLPHKAFHNVSNARIPKKVGQRVSDVLENNLGTSLTNVAVPKERRMGPPT